MKSYFSDWVEHSGMATVKELRKLVSDHRNDDMPELSLLELPRFDDGVFTQKLSDDFKIPHMDLQNAQVSIDTMSLLRKSKIIEYRCIPIQNTSSKVTLAIFDPKAVEFKNDVVKELQKPVQYILTNITSWKKLFSSVRESVDELVKSIVEITSKGSDEIDIREDQIGEDVISYVNRIFADAYVRKASDIHFEPYEKIFRIRLRLDGELVTTATPPRSMMLPILSRVKIMAQLDIAEKRKPQDGRIKIKMGNIALDFRVSTLPTLFGEKIVMRLLDQTNLQLDMTKLGFDKDQLSIFKEGISKPYGICLVTGPTGSGKTTTLYSALSELNTSDSNISTVEDPCEFNLEGVNQVNVKKDIGLDFARALKAFLRQDPDIIMVGEIRDKEVGEIAVEASLTGHLVLSTLHTNDAPSTVTRLINMGLEPFLLVAALNVIVAQRLMRKICFHCREEVEVSKVHLVACGFAPKSAEKLKVYKGRGCSQCNNTGYKGREAIFEVLEVSNKIKDLILKNAPTDEIKKAAISEGMKTLRMSALTKVAEGLSTIEEAIANSASDV